MGVTEIVFELYELKANFKGVLLLWLPIVSRK